MSNLETLKCWINDANDRRFARIVKPEEFERLYHACALARAAGVTDLTITLTHGLDLAYWDNDWVDRKRGEVLSTEVTYRDGRGWIVDRVNLTPSNPGVTKREVTCRFDGELDGWVRMSGDRWRLVI